MKIETVKISAVKSNPNNPKGKPKLIEPTKILFKRIPESIFVDCLKIVNDKIKNHGIQKNAPKTT